MKKKKIWLFTLLATMMFVCAVTPSWAYRIIVTCGLSSADEPYLGINNYSDFIVNYTMENWGSYLKPGQSAEHNNTDWKTKGLCWSSIRARMPRWPGCPTDNRYIEKNLDKCQNIKVIYTADKANCSLNFEVLNQ